KGGRGGGRRAEAAGDEATDRRTVLQQEERAEEREREEEDERREPLDPVRQALEQRRPRRRGAVLYVACSARGAAGAHVVRPLADRVERLRGRRLDLGRLLDAAAAHQDQAAHPDIA